jgi:hypothetical protein
MKAKRRGFINLGFRAFLLGVLCLPMSAAIRPSFNLDYCAWHATVVVLVEVTPSDGVFRVVQSWKGELHAGEMVRIAELIPRTDAKPISFYVARKDLFPQKDDEIPRLPVGSRMLLFVKARQTLDQPATGASASSDKSWRPADLFNEMKTSTVWMDGERLYSFQQWVNPGPSIIFPLHLSLQQARERVAEIERVQHGLTEAMNTRNDGTKAEALKPYVRSDVHEARQTALAELGRCGPSALETIHAMLGDPSFADEAPPLIKALVEAGGESVGPELDSRLKQETEFWRATAPSLPRDWWNQDPTPHAPLRERYTVTLQLVLGLERTHYKPALPTAMDLSRLWRSFPQLNDPGGLDQMAKECDKLAESLRAN